MLKCGTCGQEIHMVISFEPSKDGKTILQRHDGKPFITFTLPEGKTMDEALLELRAITLETYKADNPRMNTEPQESEHKHIAVANQWMLPNIFDYLDSRNDAVQRFAAMVKASPNPESDLSAIREAVSEHTRVLPLERLWTVSYVIADDLYKAGDRLPVWDEEHRQYVEASAATFFEGFHEKGYVLRYFINNGFEQTDWGMQRPLYLLPQLFRAAGLAYICPETLALSLMEARGTPSSDFLKEYWRYKDESRDVAKQAIRHYGKLRNSYVVLELGDDSDLLDEISADAETNAVTVFRSEPPVANSKISFTFPKTAELA
jgi:hypothetical protein